MSQYEKIHRTDAARSIVKAAYALDGNGVADGGMPRWHLVTNWVLKYVASVKKNIMFAPAYGEIVAEIAEADLAKLDDITEVAYDRFGKVLEEQAFVCGDEKVSYGRSPGSMGPVHWKKYSQPVSMV